MTTIQKAMELLATNKCRFSCSALAEAENSDHLTLNQIPGSITRRFGAFYDKNPGECWLQSTMEEYHQEKETHKNQRLIMLALFEIAEKDVLK